MTKFIHIGLPKTMTSALQMSFFSDNKDIYYLGVGNKDNLIDFIDDDVNFTFETLMLYARRNYYDIHKNKMRQHLEKHLLLAEKSDKRVFGVSLELLGLSVFPDMVDNFEKVNRLSDFFDKDTKIICFIRNQGSLIKSLYGELIKEGLSFSYNDFINYIYDFKSQNFYYDLFYDLKFESYLRYFKQENIFFLPIESYRDEDGKLISDNGEVKIIKDICNILDISYPKSFELPHVNPSLNKYELYHKLELNRRYRHGSGNLMFEHSNLHRIRKYLEKENVKSIPDFFRDVKIKRLTLENSKLLAEKSDLEIDYNVDNDILKRIFQDFIQSNMRLENNYDIQLQKFYKELAF